MQYTISINQKAFQEVAPDCDLVDAAIFDFISRFMAVDNIESITDDDGARYYWISYQHIIDQLPILNIKTKRSIYNRVENLVDAGLLVRYPNNKKMPKSYFAQGHNFSKVIWNDAKPMKQISEPSETNFIGAMKNDSELPMKEISDNHNTSNHSTKDQSVSVFGKAYDSRTLISKISEEVELKRHEPATIEEQAFMFAVFMWRSVNDLKSNNKLALKAKIGKWTAPVRQMLEEDGRDLQEMADLWRRVQTAEDSFWKKKSLSPAKFKKHFDQIAIDLKEDDSSNDFDPTGRAAAAAYQEYDEEGQLNYTPKFAPPPKRATMELTS